MKKLTTTFSLLAVFAVPFTVSAAVPPEVLKPYKAYNAAMQERDFDSALKHGKAAWKAAEKKMGDSRTTGDLAFNYGFLAKSRGKAETAIKALERGVELADQGREKGAAVRLERSVELISAYEFAGKDKNVTQSADKALEFAKNSGLRESVFAGEILVHRATACSKVANRAANRLHMKIQGPTRFDVLTNNDVTATKIQEKCTKDSSKALEIFSRNKDLARPNYIALAANQNGYGYERANDWIGAALSYQTAREAIEEPYGRSNPMVMQIIGRWIFVRGQIEFDGQLEKAKAAGLCDCWPYGANSGKVKAVKKAKLDLPKQALQIESSGFVILQADVDDAGATKNIRVVQSWPEGQYDKYALGAMEKYEYPAKSAGENAEARKDIIQAFNFTVYDPSSKRTY